VPFTVAERFKVCTVFARSEAGIVGSNPTRGMDVWCVYTFVQRHCDDLITRPRSPTVCNNDQETEKSALCSKVGTREEKENIRLYVVSFEILLINRLPPSSLVGVFSKKLCTLNFKCLL
jgi:hypothetical protein